MFRGSEITSNTIAERALYYQCIPASPFSGASFIGSNCHRSSMTVTELIALQRITEGLYCWLVCGFTHVQEQRVVIHSNQPFLAYFQELQHYDAL